ncbi:MAG: cupin domain-containing protein [Oscillospiraceae bacterium]|jgi:mannose-6-phosphate isomerase-like protein (cupin superfamily)|nr:cupin domain-containing protein [Oscillospiraceae bacterium]
MKNNYLIDITDKENWLFPTNGYDQEGDVQEEQRTISMPEGPHKLYCFTDSLMHPAKSTDPDGPVFLHEHHEGYETFFVESGGLDFYIDGKYCAVKPGSVIHIQPYQAHGMIFRDYTIYRGIFHDWNCADDSVATSLLERHYPDAKKDPVFFDLLIKNIDMYMRERADFEPAAPEDVNPVRDPGKPLARFELDGVTMKMLTARWENGGIKELWRAEMKKGFTAKWESYPTVQDLFYINKGLVRFKVYDEEFTAGENCLVKIPKYAPHSFIVEQDAVMYDVGGQTEWYSLLQDYTSIKCFDPEKAKNPEAIAALKAKFGCKVAEISYQN